MGEVRRRNDDRIDIVTRDDGFGVGGDMLRAERLSHLARAGLVLVAKNLKGRAGKVFGDDAGMVGTHDTGSDDGNADGHVSLSARESM